MSNLSTFVLVVTDINEEALKKAESEFGAKVVGLEEIYGVEADIFAPCALGATVNDDTIDQFKTPIIAGSANNVLDEDRHGGELRNREILYAPDYVINAGGLIDVARFAVGFGVEEGRKKLFQIGETLTEIFGRAENEARPTSEVADVIAEERVAKAA